jgi:hypothetical protein
MVYRINFYGMNNENINLERRRGWKNNCMQNFDKGTS